MNSEVKTVIVIPARYGSTRFPGKPLAKIAGKTLLQHVCEVATHASKVMPGVSVLVATDDDRIMRHAQELGVQAVMTPSSCPTGSDRAIAAIAQLESKPKNVINLQGDSPLTPLKVLTDLIAALEHSNVVTPVMQLHWDYLDVLRKAKITNPFSGTTVIINSDQDALWFSKQIIPALRNEEKLRQNLPKSPVYQHLGIYGYSLEMLHTFAQLPEGHYEKLEGLEQLRFLENGFKIKTVPIALENLHAWRGVDTLDDAKFVEQLILAGQVEI